MATVWRLSHEQGTSVKCTGGAAPQRSATGGHRAPGGPRAFFAFFFVFMFFGRFKKGEAFHGGRSYLLTKYQPKRTHLDPIHHIFDDFFTFFRGLGGGHARGVH